MAEDGFKWDVTPGTAFEELYSAYTYTLFTAGARISQSRADEMVGWAKNNAPWTDRTTRARKGIHAITEQNAHILAQITIAHGVRYGVWLEIAYGGKWAIITKVIDRYGPIIWRDMQNMMNLKLISA